MDYRRAFTISDTQKTLYKEWKATTDEQKYLIKKRNFRTFDNIVEKRKLEINKSITMILFRLKKMI